MPPQTQAVDDRVRLKGPDGKFYTIPSHQSGAFLRTHPDYDVAGAADTSHSDQAGKSTLALSTGIDPSKMGVAKWMGGELAGGAGDALKSVYQMGKPPEGMGEEVLNALGPGTVPIKRMVQGTLESLKDIGKVPSAISDLYHSGYGKEAIAMQVPRTMSNLLTFGKLGKMIGGRAAQGTPREIEANPTKPGSIMGAETRGKTLLDRVDAAAQDIPVDHTAAYKWAKKAEELGKHGFTVPKPVTDFIAMIESKMKPGVEPVEGQPGASIDRGAELNPLTYQSARNFEQSLGAKIPWDLDPGGKMGGLMKKMRSAIGDDTAKALKPHGLDATYLRGKAEMAKTYQSGKTMRAVGKAGGRLLGYGAGTEVGHPLILGSAGGHAGEAAGGALSKALASAGKNREVAPVRSSTPTAVDPIEWLRKTKESQKPGQNMVPVERRASTQMVAEERRKIGDRITQRGVQKAATGKGDPEAQRLRDTANPARDTGILDRVRAQHPDWSLSKQLMEAAKRAQETGQ